MGSTRKFWLALALTAIVAIAVVAPAFASVGGSGYLTWTSPTGSPHGGYTTSTQRCKVCHAVHNASTAAGAQLLLRSSVVDACNYCHVGGGGGYTTVYGGIVGNYSGTDFTTAHNTYGGGGVKCTNCHQVHAADNTMTANAYLTSKLLIGSKTDFTEYDTFAQQPLVGDTSNTALTKWCTRCHPVGLGTSYGYYNGVDYSGSGNSYLYKGSHVMTIAAASYTSPSGFTGKIAWADSTQCSSCHNHDFGLPAWPHYTAGAARFLSAGGSITSASVGATNSADDGVCLRCHRDGVTSGTGMNY
jgi:hypothetical protein